MDTRYHALILALVLSQPAVAAQLKIGDVAVAVSRDGCGFVDVIRFKGREVVRAREGFVGASVALAEAGDGTLDSLFPHRAAVTLPAKIAAVTAKADALTVTGAYTDGRVSLPFTRTLRLRAGTNAIAVREETDFGRLPADRVVAEHALTLPLVVCADEHLRMLAFGGGGSRRPEAVRPHGRTATARVERPRRAEMFRMDMNDERRRNQLISCSRAFRPYWDIGGVLQLPGSYRIWRANHADTMAYPIEDGRGAPGWADYSELDWGITAAVTRPAATAPWAIAIDARKGLLSFAPHPASQIPLADRGTRIFEFTLTLHDASWPAAWPCELSFERYKQLLAWLNQGSRYTHLDYVCGRIGVMAPQGRKTPEQMADVCRRVIFKERVQPSVLLRLFYRGDGWRMAGLVQQVLGRRVSRSQPMADWDKLAKELLDTIRKDGPPPASSGR